jgi:hypothetical protein
MKLFETAFFWIGANFTTEVYMLSSRIQGILWSMADIVLVFVFLKICDLIRDQKKKKKILFRYFLLWLTAILTPLLIFTHEPKEFLILESAICGTQFAILVYTVIIERKSMVVFLKEILSKSIC